MELVAKQAVLKGILKVWTKQLPEGWEPSAAGRESL